MCEDRSKMKDTKLRNFLLGSILVGGLATGVAKGGGRVWWQSHQNDLCAYYLGDMIDRLESVFICNMRIHLCGGYFGMSRRIQRKLPQMVALWKNEPKQ